MTKHTILANGGHDLAATSHRSRIGRHRRWLAGCAALVAVVPMLAFAPPNASAVETGSISGRVTDQTGAPLEGVEVVAYNLEWLSGAYTDANGDYEIADLPADAYVVRWWDIFDLYGGDLGYYDGVLYAEDATPVRVAEGEMVVGIDGVLLNPPPGDGSIAGRVTDERGTPLEGICVQAWNRVNGGRGETTTGADGTYLIGALPTSDAYKVWFIGSCADHGAISEYFDDAPDEASADFVAVVDGQETTGIDAALAVPGSISGRVTDEHGDPLAAICVYLYPSRGHQVTRGPVFTAEDGSYRFTGLETGSYKVWFVDCTERYGALNEAWDDAHTLDEADDVHVAFGEDTAGIDAALARPEFGGFLSPVVAPPTLNMARAGTTVPVRFTLGGDFGLELLRNSTYSRRVDCADPSSTTGASRQTRSTDGREFVYHDATDRYRYRWKTERVWRGTCRVFSLFLMDGEHEAWFQFRGRPAG